MPTVAVIVVNMNGREHLATCLDSLAALEYPAERLQVLVVDNGSEDGSVDIVRAHPLGASVLELGTNRGFADAVNQGARHVETDCVALLNNDMRVDGAWLRELVRAYRPADGVTCVGGMILDWSGERIDFDGAAANFHGFGDQPRHGEPVPQRTEQAIAAPMLFACGGSMLVNRERFLEVGGFDPAFFAYFEDVDFGWRLNVLGDEVAYAPTSRCFHRHHGTSRRFASYQRTLLLERNAIRALIKNTDERHLGQMLAPALLLLVGRVLDVAQSDRGDYDAFARAIGADAVPPDGMARLHAVGDILQDLPGLFLQRADIQSRRGTDDRVIFERFGALVDPIGSTSTEYDATFRAIVDLFGISNAGDAKRTPVPEQLQRLGVDRGRLRQAVARSRHRDRILRLRGRLRRSS